MATITQRLAFLISANAEQAIKAFDKTASTAEKQMGKAGKSIDKLGVSMTKFGAAGLAAAGTLGAGLFKLAQGAIEDQKAQALLAEQLRNTADATDGQIKAVENLIDSTARATGVADDQLRPALGNLVRGFGDVDKATKVLTTALDISAATGRDLETVTVALGRAANGNVGALTRLGIPLDENVKKSKDFGQALTALNDQFGGAAAARAETYAGKIDRTKVALSEAGEAIGEAFVPVIEDVSALVTKGVGIFDDFNKTTDGLAGKLLALGTVGLGAVSALSLVAGQAIKVRDALFVLDEVTGRSTLSLSKLGKGLLGAGAIIGGAAVVYSAYSSKKREAEQRTRDLAAALELEGEAQREALRELAAADQRVRQHVTTLNLLGLKVGDVTKEIDGGATAFDGIRSALADYQKQIGYAGAEQRFAEAIGYQGELTRGQINAIASLTKEVDRQIESQKDAADAFDETNRALGDLGYQYDETMVRGKEYQDAIKEFVQSRASEKYNEIVQARRDALERQAESERKAAQAAEEFKRKVLDQAAAVRTNLNTALQVAKSRLDQVVSSYRAYSDSVSASVMGTLNLASAQETARTNTERIATAQQRVTDAEEKYSNLLQTVNANQNDVIATRKELADATAELNAALAAPTDFLAVFRGQETAAKEFAGNVQRLLDLNADRTVIDQLVSAGAQTGNEIARSILSGADPAGNVAQINTIVANTKKIADDLGTNAAEKYFRNGVTLAENLVAGVNSVLKRAKIDLKWKGLDKSGKPLKRLNNLTDLFQSQITGFFQTAGISEDIPQLADGGIVRARRGGTLALLGEGGRDEAVVPLPDRGGLGGTSINVTVNAGMGSDGSTIGRAIVDELVAYQRRVGALPIKVTG